MKSRNRRTTKQELEEQLLKLEVDCDIVRHRIRMRDAEETVTKSGIPHGHEDFWMEVEQEIDRLWEEETNWERRKHEDQMCWEMQRENLLREAEEAAKKLPKHA